MGDWIYMDSATGLPYPNIPSAHKQNVDGEIPSYNGRLEAEADEDHEFRRVPVREKGKIVRDYMYMDSATGLPYPNIPSAHKQNAVGNELEAPPSPRDDDFRRRAFPRGPGRLAYMNTATGLPYPD